MRSSQSQWKKTWDFNSFSSRGGQLYWPDLVGFHHYPPWKLPTTFSLGTLIPFETFQRKYSRHWVKILKPILVHSKTNIGDHSVLWGQTILKTPLIQIRYPFKTSIAFYFNSPNPQTCSIGTHSLTWWDLETSCDCVMISIFKVILEMFHNSCRHGKSYMWHTRNFSQVKTGQCKKENEYPVLLYCRTAIVFCFYQVNSLSFSPKSRNISKRMMLNAS